jgi:NAD(P)-dependent dehydrogenase (short-subunit alcohol dehydrogenase family)
MGPRQRPKIHFVAAIRTGQRPEEKHMPDQLRLDDRVAVVTGAGRGIGRAHALALASRGAKVLVNDLGGSVLGESSSAEPAREVVQEIVSAGGEAIANCDDVSTPTGAEAVIAAALQEFDRVDIVVANAGISYPQRSFAETTFESFDRMLRVHAYGTFNVLHAVWPHLVEKRYGRIITTTSQAGLYGQPGSQEYSAAKGAIIGLTLSLAHESEQHGIRVNGVAPAAFTRMVEDLDVDDEAMAALKQLLAPELVSPTVVWLAHESCSVNGQFFEAGAGRTARAYIGEAQGHWASRPTPEDIVAHIDVVQSKEDLLYHADAMGFAAWMMENAGSRAAGAATQSS